jgi:hypothetical protein
MHNIYPVIVANIVTWVLDWKTTMVDKSIQLQGEDVQPELLMSDSKCNI